MATSGPAAAGSRAIDAPLPISDYSNQVVILGRLKPGYVRESRRVVHVFPLTTQGLPNTTITARCGERLRVADTQWLPTLIGMPCEHCVLQSVPIAE